MTATNRLMRVVSQWMAPPDPNHQNAARKG